jgi:hypothetical protein
VNTMGWPLDARVRDGSAVLEAAAGALGPVVADPAWAQDASGTGSHGPWVERRWMTADGLTVVLTVVVPPAGATAAETALAAVVGRTLGRYRTWFAGTIELDVGLEGTVLGEARLCRLRVTSAAGEPLIVGVLAGVVGDGAVVIAETAYAEAVGALRAPDAALVVASLARPAVTS